MQLVLGIMLCEGTERERWEESESPENFKQCRRSAKQIVSRRSASCRAKQGPSLAASDPAMARTGTMTRNFPQSIAKAVRLKKIVLALRPAKALPLVAAAEV